MKPRVNNNLLASPKPNPPEPAPAYGAEPTAKVQRSHPVADFYRFTKHKLHEKQGHMPWSADTWAQTLKRLKLSHEPKTSPLAPPTVGRARSHSLPKALNAPFPQAPSEPAAATGQASQGQASATPAPQDA